MHNYPLSRHQNQIVHKMKAIFHFNVIRTPTLHIVCVHKIWTYLKAIRAEMLFREVSF